MEMSITLASLAVIGLSGGIDTLYYARWVRRVYPDLERSERVIIIDAFRAVGMRRQDLMITRFAVPADVTLMWARAQLAIMDLYAAARRGK